MRSTSLLVSLYSYLLLLQARSFLLSLLVDPTKEPRLLLSWPLFPSTTSAIGFAESTALKAPCAAVAAPVAAVAAVAGAAAPAEEEKDEFDVILSAVGDKKIQVIKLSAPSPTSAWPRPRLLSTALRRPSSRRPRRKMPRRPRLSWKRLAPASSSSDLCGISRNHSFEEATAPVFQAAGFPAYVSRLVDEDEAENAIRRGNTKLAMSESCQFCAQ